MGKKLIEVAMPLEAINAASKREKSVRHGHPSTIHLWWARRPLAACSAVIFASLVDDPSAHPEDFPTEEDQKRERERLFDIIRDLVKWEARKLPTSKNEERQQRKILERARGELKRQAKKYGNGELPPIYDPFSGGGSIPLEAQRLGLKAYGSDLNPVAVLIGKALIEIPPRFAGLPPINPKAQSSLGGNHNYAGASGLAEDVEYYGEWMNEKAFERIGHLYPEIELAEKDGGGKATVIAWLWARTSSCPNPACGAEMPLISSFWLSKKKGKKAWIEPQVDQATKSVTFEIRRGKGKPRTAPKVGRGAKFECLCCGQVTEDEHFQVAGADGEIGTRLMAVVVEGPSGRAYISPSDVDVPDVERPAESWMQANLPDNARWFSPPVYGFNTYGELFTNRQLVALTTFSNLVDEVRAAATQRAVAADMRDDGVALHEGGTGATAYADAVAAYLAFAVDRSADYWSEICTWHSSRETIRNTFSRQAIPMTWDFAEVNPFSNSTGNFAGALMWIRKNIEAAPALAEGQVVQHDATREPPFEESPVVSTDPPYYDNIGYADLSDFFYVWLRRSLGNVHPDLFTTLLTPKSSELIANKYRFNGDQVEAERFFEEGLLDTFKSARRYEHSDYPMTVFYAFKQAESRGDDGIASTGWETMLEGLIQSDYEITGTWPMRTELSNRVVGRGANMLASSIVLVCRPRPEDAAMATRREFVSALEQEMPEALAKLQHGNVAPVDMAQASIGPGMAIFSRYSKVMESDGSRMSVGTALGLINQVLDEILAEQESEYDAETRWAVAWFEQNGFEPDDYGVAETLSKAKNTSVQGMVEAGVLKSGGGKVHLLRREEMPKDWDPSKDERLTVWEVAQHLVRRLEEEGEAGAAELLAELGSVGQVGRDLAYRLYNICERKEWAQEAIGYNALVVSWPEIKKLAARVEEEAEEPEQAELV